jgi:hypothetical protein
VAPPRHCASSGEYTFKTPEALEASTALSAGKSEDGGSIVDSGPRKSQRMRGDGAPVVSLKGIYLAFSR